MLAISYMGAGEEGKSYCLIDSPTKGDRSASDRLLPYSATTHHYQHLQVQDPCEKVPP